MITIETVCDKKLSTCHRQNNLKKGVKGSISFNITDYSLYLVIIVIKS